MCYVSGNKISNWLKQSKIISLVPLYVQHDYDSPMKIVRDERLQYCMNHGVFLAVLHDKSQTPYQHLFIQNEIQRNL